MISKLWIWFAKNRVEAGKGDPWKLDSCKIENLRHIFRKLYQEEF